MNYTIYKNKEELKEQNPTLFEITNNNLELDENDIIHIYDSPKSYAKYSIQNGYCTEIFANKNLSDFVDYTNLGIYMLQSINYAKLGDYIIQHMNKEENHYDKNTNIIISIIREEIK